MNQRKVRTEGYSLNQTFGNPASLSNEECAQEETRIRIHSGFQESYLQSKLNGVSSNSNLNTQSVGTGRNVQQQLQIGRNRVCSLRQQVEGEAKVLNIQRSINLYLKSLIKDSLKPGESECRQSQIPLQQVREYLKLIHSYQESVQSLNNHII